jgi:hypothetical protein
MNSYSQSPLALRRSDGVLECWEDVPEKVSIYITSLFHYIPLLQCSKGVGFKNKTEAEGNMAPKR